MSLRHRLDDVVRPGDQDHAYARLGQIHDRESNEERRGGGDLEEDDRFESHPTDLLQAPGARGPDYDGGEDERCDDRFDEVEENVTQEIDLVPPIWSQPADESADDETEK